MAGSPDTPGPRAPRGDDLAGRAAEAHRLALARLLEAQHPVGSWSMTILCNAVLSAAYVIMARTTGLIDREGEFDLEADIVRHLLSEMNPDGGFRKYPGAGSSRRVTQTGLAALRLALGEVAPGPRPAGRFRANPQVEGDFRRRVLAAQARAEAFLAIRGPAPGEAPDPELRGAADLLVGHADPARGRPPPFFLRAAPMARVSRSPLLRALSRQVWMPLRGVLPGFAILAEGARGRAPDAAVRELALAIRKAQDPCGGWMVNGFHSALNIMALSAAGADLDDPAVRAAHRHLRTLIRSDGRGRFLRAFDSAVYDTAGALETYARIPGRRPQDEPCARAVGFLLQRPSADGGFGWSRGFTNGAESDTTALVVRAFPWVLAADGGAAREEVRRALSRGLDFMRARQRWDGGFCCWERTIVPGRRKPSGLRRQMLFDEPAADVTARIVETFAAAGLTARDESLRRALRFLLRAQFRNGAWWSRWWAGGIGGTNFPLRAFARLGLRQEREPPPGDGLTAAVHAAIRRAMAFLLSRQNEDGGWGETVAADTDFRLAGVGASTPLHTAHTAGTLIRIGCPPDSPAVRRAMEWLLDAMTPDGRWHDGQATFTVLAGSLYYAYEFQTLITPLSALTDFLRARDR